MPTSPFILFETGSLAGRSFPVPDGSSVSVGRSHSCTVRPTEADVSGRHVVVRSEGGALRVDVLSSHRTALDGSRLSAGMSKLLRDGSRVELGSSLAFVVRLGEIGEDDTAEMQGASGETGTGVLSGTSGRAPASTGSLATSAGTETFPTSAGAATSSHSAGSFPTSAPTGTFSAGAAGDDGETGFLTRDAGPRSGGGFSSPDGETGDSGGGETVGPETQMASPDEIALMRGVHLRRQKRRFGLRFLALAAVLAAVFGLYAWLSRVTVKPYLLAPVITFNGVIDDGNGKVGVAVPFWNGGAWSSADGRCVRWDSRLGDDWAVPFTIVLTNYVDEASLFESREDTFARWRAANMRGLWRDGGEVQGHRFLGGEGGAYPGVPCLQRRYTRVDDAGENLAGTATFFRLADRCYVLLREVPAEEEGRAYSWLEEVWTTLFARTKNPDGTENLFAARHWEGTPERDDGLDPAAAVDACRRKVENEDVASWAMSETQLVLVLRSLHGKTDAASSSLRELAFDTLVRLRASQHKFWNQQCVTALKNSDPSVPDGARTLETVRRSAEALFSSPDDERHWLLGRQDWWLAHPEGF